MKKHYVIFFSPGTFVAEQSKKEIDGWNVEKVIEMAKDIKERHNAVPYGFQFITRVRKSIDFDSKETKRSNMYYLGGKIETLKEIKKRNDPSERILLNNMVSNKYDKIIVNTNSWKWTQPLEKDDVVLDVNFSNKASKVNECTVQ